MEPPIANKTPTLTPAPSSSASASQRGRSIDSSTTKRKRSGNTSESKKLQSVELPLSLDELKKSFEIAWRVPEIAELVSLTVDKRVIVQFDDSASDDYEDF